MEKYSSIRNIEKWDGEKFYFSSLSEFLESKNIPNGIITIDLFGFLIDLNVRIIKFAPIAFLFHGAVKRSNDFKLPVFSGFNIIGENCSRVMISDPTLLLSNDITLGWYMGSKKLNLRVILPLIIAKIQEFSGSSRPIFVGGSGGGFAALYYGKKIKGSIVVAANPQTDIFKYYRTHIEKFLKNFPIGIEEAKNILNCDLCSVYSEGFSCLVFYIQNIQDHFHCENHCKPFIKKIGELSNDKIFLDLYDWGEGHKPPPPKYWKKVIDFFAEYPKEIGQVFKSEDFIKFKNSSKFDFENSSRNRIGVFDGKADCIKLHEIIFSVEKPDPQIFRRYFNIAKYQSSEEEVEKVFQQALKYYPHGWSVKLAYAKAVAHFGNTKKSLDLAKEIASRLGDKTPEDVAKFINLLTDDKYHG